MKFDIKTVLIGAAVLAGGYWLYTKSKAAPATLSSVPVGEPSQYTFTQGQADQTISMKVGDYLQAPGQSAGPMEQSGDSVFGGNESHLVNGGTITAMSPGTETFKWSDGTSGTVTVS